MEFFKRAKVFRLKCGHQNKYLSAHKDEETITQTKTTSSIYTHWVIEPVESNPSLVRFRNSQTHKYLAVTDEALMTGLTGKRVAQRLRLDESVEWEPVKDGVYVKLKSRGGTLLRANPGIPPWRNTVTHDLPGHWTGSEKMVLWIVDIVQIDYHSNHGGNNAGAAGAADHSGDGGVKVDSAPPQVFKPATNVPSSSAPPQVFKPATDVPSSSSNDENWKNQSGNPPSVLTEDNGPNRLEKSDSKSKLEKENSDRLSRLPSAESMSRLAVNVAMITVKELKNFEFHAVLTSGQLSKLEKAISVIAADAKISGQGNEDLANLEERLKNLSVDHERASQELVECTTFSHRRYELRAELKKDAAKAHELETIDAELNNTLIAAKGRREELLKQLQETEDSIKSAEKGQDDCKVEIEELFSKINRKSEVFKDMERDQGSWDERKYEAERMLERIQEDWLEVKDIITRFW